MANEKMAAALFDAREETRGLMERLAKTWGPVISPFRNEMGIDWIRGLFKSGPQSSAEDPGSMVRSADFLFSHPSFSKAETVESQMTIAITDWLKSIEAKVYRFETDGVAKALQKTTPSWVRIRSEIDPEEERLAGSALINGLPQWMAARRLVRNLIDTIQSAVARARLRTSGAWEATTLEAFRHVETAFDSVGVGLQGLAEEAGTWAANVAKQSINEKLGTVTNGIGHIVAG